MRKSEREAASIAFGSLRFEVRGWRQKKLEAQNWKPIIGIEQGAKGMEATNFFASSLKPPTPKAHGL